MKLSKIRKIIGMQGDGEDMGGFGGGVRIRSIYII